MRNPISRSRILCGYDIVENSAKRWSYRFKMKEKTHCLHVHVIHDFHQRDFSKGGCLFFHIDLPLFEN